MADALDISYATWYSMKRRLREQGGPEALYEWMKESAKRRYNRASSDRSRVGSKGQETLAEALVRIYTIRSSMSGRDGLQSQYTATIPPTLAIPFISQYGTDFRWEAAADGLLMRPIPAAPPSLPAWLETAIDPRSEGTPE